MMARVLVQSSNFNPCVGCRNCLEGGYEYGLANKTNNVKLVRQNNSLHWRSRRGQQRNQSVLGFTGRRRLLESNTNAFNSSVISFSSAFDFHCGRRQRRRGNHHHHRYVLAKVSSIFEQHFTERGLDITKFAKEEARRMGHNYVGSEHILLGLIAEDKGIGAKVLKSMGISLKDAREKVEMIIDMDKEDDYKEEEEEEKEEVPIFTPRARCVFEMSLEIARELGHNYIESEHLLLGLLREGEGSVAACVLKNLGADLKNVHRQVLRMMSESNGVVGASVGGLNIDSKMSTLDDLSTNLTKFDEEKQEKTKSSNVLDDGVCCSSIGESSVEEKMITVHDDSQDGNVKPVSKRRNRIIKILIITFLLLGFLALVFYILFWLFVYFAAHFIFLLIPMSIASAFSVKLNLK